MCVVFACVCVYWLLVKVKVFLFVYCLVGGKHNLLHIIILFTHKMCVCVCVFVFVFVFSCICVMYVFMYVCVCMCVYACAYACMYVCINV